MLRIVVLTLGALIALSAGAGAQTGPAAAGASTVSPRSGAAGAPAPTASGASGRPNMLVDFTRNFIGAQTQYSANVVSDTLAAALQRSRDVVRGDSRPVPEQVKRGLLPFFPEATFENVRYAIGDTSNTGLAGFAIRNGNAAAVTLIDTIVFKDEKFVGSLALWAHELHHIEQYRQWGLKGFAGQYAFGWRDVEADARARAGEFVAWYRERKGLK